MQSSILDWHEAVEKEFLAARIQVLKAGNMAAFKQMMKVSLSSKAVI